MEIKTCFNDATLEITPEKLVIERENGFLSLATSKIGGGIRSTHRILNLNQNDSGKKPLSSYLEEKPDRNSMENTIISTNGIDKILHLTNEEITVIILADKAFNLNYIVLICADLNGTSLVNIFKDVLESKLNTLTDSGIKRLEDVSRHDEVIVACRGGETTLEEDEITKIRFKVREQVQEASFKLFKNMGYPPDILGHIESTGVKISDLVEAGMELVVGVERTEELDLKLAEQLLKSLEDLNVATLILAGIRLEEDLYLKRIRGIDVEDDPAYLYSDEVLGMAIANQIAGTKAIFNFKRYDEEKPGVIGKLGPVLDDVFAGLLAGCMSRIFEE
jgi:alpha-ribazole phosphatase CobZ